nr:facilitated trehalose transporter Tret1-like [Onthophagus taurus]XP_022912035.1 facilitated trehalose transporter Tret1-like [Onthophagus taurus]
MHHIFDKIKKHWEYGLGRTAIAAICAHSVSISIGICQGYSAILIPQLLNSTESIKIDLEQASWLASFGAITNPIGSILSGLIAEWFGRKISIQFSSIPFIIGWICVSLSENIHILYIGRLITGIAAGMATASYTYVSEISTASTRGTFQALGPVSASFGILLTYSLGYFFHWKITSLLSIIFALFTLITVHFLPESPSFLYKKKKKDSTKKSLFWFRRNLILVQDEYNRFEEYNLNKNQDKFSLRYYFSKETTKPFLILLILFLLQEASGIYAILFYSVNFFKDAKIDIDEFISSIIVGLIRFVMSILGAILINKFNRKSLCLISSFGMALSMFVILGYLKYLELTKTKNTFTIIPLICVLANVFFSMIGMLPIPWILVGELFSIRVRSIMMGLVICLAQIFIFISVKFYPLSIETFKFFGTCTIFFIASILSVLFSRFVLPETKNKTLEEIEETFKHKISLKNNFGVINKAFDLKSEINRNDLNGVFTVKLS